MGTGDIIPTLTAAILRTTATTAAAIGTYEPRFWIRRAIMKVTIVNNSQVALYFICVD